VRLLRTLPLLAVAASLMRAAEPAGWIESAGGTITRTPNGQIIGVDLRSTWVTDSDLARLSVLSGLLNTNLSLTRVSDHGLQELRNAPSITNLDLRYAEMITDGGLMALRGWKHLKRLNLRGTKVTDAGLQHLSTVTSLESLDLGFVQVTDVGLDQLTSLPKLKELTLGGNKLTDTGLEALRQLPGLIYLDLGGAQRTDSGMWSVSIGEKGVAAIASLQNLRRLTLTGLAVSPRELESLRALTRLERLDLQDCRHVNDDAIPLLSSMPSVRIVDLSRAGISEAGLARLRKAKPNCKILASTGANTTASSAHVDRSKR
jgi:Leucine-rich repeat (LRR) protein